MVMGTALPSHGEEEKEEEEGHSTMVNGSSSNQIHEEVTSEVSDVMATEGTATRATSNAAVASTETASVLEQEEVERVRYYPIASQRDTRRSSDSGAALIQIQNDIRSGRFLTYDADEQEDEDEQEEDEDEDEAYGYYHYTFTPRTNSFSYNNHHPSLSRWQERQEDNSERSIFFAHNDAPLSRRTKLSADCRPGKNDGVNRLIYSHLFSNVHLQTRTVQEDDQQGNTESNEMKMKKRNVVHSLLARELTGKPSGPPLHMSSFSSNQHSPIKSSPSTRLHTIGGATLFSKLDNPASGIATETHHLSDAIQAKDWTEIQLIISKLLPRLIGDPSSSSSNDNNNRNNTIGGGGIEDSSIPPNTSRYYAGGGRLGLERDAFVQSNGIQLLHQIFLNPPLSSSSFSTTTANSTTTTSSSSLRCAIKSATTTNAHKFYQTNDARYISKEEVSTKLSGCWNESLAILRECASAMPELVHDGVMLKDGEFMPFLFTLLSHDSCFDACAAMIEEMLSLMGNYGVASNSNGGERGNSSSSYIPTTFFLGNVPNLYSLWRNFSCRHLAHFCRILALLVFEPEDRQLMESPAIHKSTQLLQLRRDRAHRVGIDASVDMNQAIVLGDVVLMQRLVDLLKVMNYAPDLRQSGCYHVMAHFPWIADTLLMLGLNEVDTWENVERLDSLARKLIVPSSSESESSPSLSSTSQRRRRRVSRLSHLGNIADMLENLAGPLLGSGTSDDGIAASGRAVGGGPVGGPVGGNSTYLGHIIHVINAAQQAGVVAGRQRNPVSSTAQQQRQPQDQPSPRLRRRNSSSDNTIMQPVSIPAQPNGPSPAPQSQSSQNHYHIQSRFQQCESNDSSLQDAANELQFNALLLAPFQVEVLFVLCTLLGGRRKIDAQRILTDVGIVPVLGDMFHRLSWGPSNCTFDDEEREVSNNHYGQQQHNRPQTNNTDGNGNNSGGGVHGPGCECNPESALRVQYLRLMHNFCDRDCDNYTGRRLLLSPSERAFIFGGGDNNEIDSSYIPPPHLKKERGLLSKVMHAFVREPNDSPYKFWLASCVESFLRGSSLKEQLFVANTGLLKHLVKYILSDRLHCAGSLQTAFDLLGELCKGNVETLQMLVEDLDEDRFRNLMQVASESLVDSNVFLRSLILTVERAAVIPLRLLPFSQVTQSVSDSYHHGHVDDSGVNSKDSDEDFINSQLSSWCGDTGTSSRSYLTHTWWDIPASGSADSETAIFYQDGEPADIYHLPEDFVAPQGIPTSSSSLGSSQNVTFSTKQINSYNEWRFDEGRESDWFYPFAAMGDDDVGADNFCLSNGQQRPLHRDTTNCICDDGMVETPTLRSSLIPGELSCLFSHTKGSLGWTFIPPIPDDHHHHDLYHSNSPYNNRRYQSNDHSDSNVLQHSLFQKATYEPNTIERMAWFLTVNQTRLLRDLLGVVNLQNINHENICCLNTVVVLSIFAHRRKQLAQVIKELRCIYMEEKSCTSQFHHRSVSDGGYCDQHQSDKNDILSSLNALNIGTKNEWHPDGMQNYGVKKRSSLAHRINIHHDDKPGGEFSPNTILRNFRELLWFWREYYTNRGRDRLSLEFSSHLRFEEWENVVNVLCADDGSSTSLLSSPMRLPKSPYKKSPRFV